MTTTSVDFEQDQPLAPGNRAETLLTHATIAIVTLIPLTLIALLGEDRLLNGVNLWIKPLKFQASVALHVATLLVLVRLVAPEWRAGRTMGGIAWACAVAALFEVGYITFKAARGEHSHFNVSTPTDQILYGVMGVGAVTLIAAAAWIGIQILRRTRPGLGRGMRAGAGWGLILGFAATLIVAGFMSNGMGHWVGGPPTDANGLPIVGWARGGGDLRVPHFFATHIMQVLPLVGLAADKWTTRPVATVWIAAAFGLAITAATFVQALSGQPLLG